MQQVQNQPYLPANQPVRTGPSKLSQVNHYDTPFWGYGQVWANDDAGIPCFTDQTRCRTRALCSLNKAGEFSDDKEFHAYWIGVEMNFGDPSLYELLAHYARLDFYKQQDTLESTMWISHLSAGGGVWITDVNNGAFHGNNGNPVAGNMYYTAVPWIFPPGKTWGMFLKFMVLDGIAAGSALQPTALFNVDVDTESEILKLVRVHLRGKEFKDSTV